MAKLKKSVSGFEKWRWEHTAALRRPQIIPMKGDSLRARMVLSDIGRTYYYAASNPLHYDRRNRLVEARYVDWLAERGVKGT